MELHAPTHRLLILLSYFLENETISDLQPSQVPSGHFLGRSKWPYDQRKLHHSDVGLSNRLFIVWQRCVRNAHWVVPVVTLILTFPLSLSPRKRTGTSKDSPGIHIKQKPSLFFHTGAVRTVQKYEAYRRGRGKHKVTWKSVPSCLSRFLPEWKLRRNASSRWWVFTGKFFYRNLLQSQH